MKLLLSIISLLATTAAIAQPAWQQKVDTKIDVTLDDKKHMLSAYEEITYTNNSPDTLNYIYIHLWPNAYRDDHTPFARQQDQNHNTTFYYSKPADKGYIDSLQFTVDGRNAEYSSSENAPDIARLELSTPLLPHHSVKIATPFKVKIPKVFSRMGHTGQSYYISQWFPKPAVYDQKGWHPISYLDQGEFFSEYGSYNVSITLPANYVVMATGNCADEKENLWLDELSKKPLPDTHYKLTVQQRDSAVASASETKTIHFQEDNVHDFAWFADKRWVVRKDTVYTPGTNELVTTYAAFMPSYWQQWQKATDYLKETVRHYGKWVGPYQYKTIKAVLGDLRAGGGMEYPTVTVIDKTASSGLQMVVVHEAGHNWFYGMLGSNERDHAWMDEGINSFYEQKTTDAINESKGTKRKTGFNEELVLYQRMATHNDQAIEQTSANFEKLNYGLDIYYKTALSLKWLESWMGKENFEKGMHDYFEKWHFHHPYPEDFKACMQRYLPENTKYRIDGVEVSNTGEHSIDWFFDPVLTTDNKLDFKVTKARKGKVEAGASRFTDVTIINNTGIYAPALIDVMQGDSVLEKIWTKPFTGATTVTFGNKYWSSLKIDNIIPDAKPQNDVYRRRALFHHFGLKVKPLAGLNRDDKDKVYISPAVAYNQFDGFMAGLLIHDLTIPENRFRFAVAPLYSFQRNTLGGAASVGYIWYPGGFCREIMLQTDAKTFHYADQAMAGGAVHESYTKVAPSLSFTFRRSPVSAVTRKLTLKGYAITEEYAVESPGIIGTNIVKQRNYTIAKADYNHSNSRTYNPFGYNFEAQASSDFVKLSAEGNLVIDYNRPRKHLFLRGYLGKFIAINNTTEVINKFGLTGTYSGVNDYLYDGTYIGRTAYNNGASQQISMQEGGFKVPVFNGAAHSSDWLASINLKTDLPIKLPIRLFFDAGLIPNATPSFTNSSNSTLLYDGGIEIPILNNVASIYIPIIMSGEFQNYINDNFSHKSSFLHGISFTLQLQNINWLKAPERGLKILAGG